jgi:hypothetical protein
MPTSTSTPIVHSRLLALPLELRNKVYEYVFNEAAPAGQATRIKEGPQRSKPFLCTSRQIYSEARGIYKAAYRTYLASMTWLLKYHANGYARAVNEVSLVTNEDLRYLSRIELHLHFVGLAKPFVVLLAKDSNKRGALGQQL